MPKRLLQILIPGLMILGIFALWYLEQSDSKKNTSSDNLINQVYALEESKLDLIALKKEKVPIIIDFGADSCIPCKEMAPVLVKLNQEMQNKALIKFVDVWKNPEATEGLPVQVIPTQLIFNADGSPYVPKDSKNMKFLMYDNKDNNEHIFTVHQGGLNETQMRHILKELGV